MVILNGPKITRTTKRFYPEWAVKVRAPKGAINLRFARNRCSFSLRRWLSMRCRDDKNHRSQNNCGGKKRAQIQRLAGKKPAKQQSHHRINKRIRSHSRSRAVLQNVDVS